MGNVLYRGDNSLMWDSLSLPVLIKQLTHYAPDNVEVHVITELDSECVGLRSCESGHVHVEIGYGASYAEVIAVLVHAVAMARIIGRQDGSLVTEASVRAETWALLALTPDVLRDLPDSLKREMFAKPPFLGTELLH